jgi:hypothetical protein
MTWKNEEELRQLEAESRKLQHEVLHLLATNRIGSLYALDSAETTAALKQRLGPSYTPSRVDLSSAVWSLIRRGLVHLVFGRDSDPLHWKPGLTLAGTHYVKEGESSPHDPDGFLARLKRKVPAISEVTFRYVQEAVRSFNQEVYLGATILIGVASEAAFLEMAEAFLKTLSGTELTNFERTLHGSSMFSAKFNEFRKKIEVRKATLPEDFQDGMALHLDAIADLLRRQRNDAGHPTGKPVDKDDVRVALEMATTYLGKLYGLTAHFEARATEVPGG